MELKSTPVRSSRAPRQIVDRARIPVGHTSKMRQLGSNRADSCFIGAMASTAESVTGNALVRSTTLLATARGDTPTCGVRQWSITQMKRLGSTKMPGKMENQRNRKIRRFNAPRISRSDFVALPADERPSIIPRHRSAAPLPLTLSLKLPRSKSKKLDARREGGGTSATLGSFALSVVVGFGKCNSMS